MDCRCEDDERLVCKGSICYCIGEAEVEKTSSDFVWPFVGEAKTADNQIAGDKSDYLMGHVIIGLIAIVESITPLLIGQLWYKPKFES